MEHVEMPVANPAHAQADANAVLAALTILSRGASMGVVTADEPFHPAVAPEFDALLRAATVMQTEISLSIVASDPFIGEAAHELEDFRDNHPERSMEELVEVIDNRVHDMIDLLKGRAPQLHRIALRLTDEGELTLSQIELILREG